MIKLVFVAIAALLILGAFAQNRPIEVVNSQSLPYRDSGLPTIITFPDMTNEQLSRDRQWVEYCGLANYVDEYGVTRFVYRHPGCEYGRIN